MCWDCGDNPKGDPYKIFRQGGVPVEDFEEEIRYRHAPNKKKKAKSPRAQANRGCQMNDGKEHIYVWTTERNIEDLFFRFYKFHKWESEYCCGCGMRRGSRLTERYLKVKDRKFKKLTNGAEFNVKRGEPVPMRWRFRRSVIPSYSHFSWEDRDEDYMTYRAEYIKQNGYNDYVHGNRYTWWF